MFCKTPMTFAEYQEPNNDLEARALSDKLFEEALAKVQVAWAKKDFSEAEKWAGNMLDLSCMRGRLG